MDLKTQIIQEYLLQGCGFRKLAAKYGISRTTICKWVMIHQGIHNLPPTEKQQKYSISSMGFHKPSDRFFTTFEHNLQYEKAACLFIFCSMDAECL